MDNEELNIKLTDQELDELIRDLPCIIRELEMWAGRI